MGASDSKLVFKQGVFKLSEQQNISANDPYWAGFWQLPESAEDVFSLLSSSDIRRIRDESIDNLRKLVLAVVSKLCSIRNDPAFPHVDTSPERDALNCVRVLTRLLPFIYEAEHLEAWEEELFWEPRNIHEIGQTGDGVTEVVFENDPAIPSIAGQRARPLGQELIDTLVDLLFFADFTLPAVPGAKDKVHFAIWQSGVGCNSPVGSTKEFDNNRMEVLRLLLTMASKSMFTSSNVLPVQGVRTLTYITTIPDKHLVLTLLCSLLNTTLKYNPASWRVPYDHVVFKDPRQLFVTYCLHLLLVLVLYPVPETGEGNLPKNYFRHFLGKLHRAQDFQFLVDGMTRILNQPLQATTAVLPGSQKSLTWAPEMIMLFWEVLQCNRRFRSFIVDTDRAHDFVILVLFQAMEHNSDQSRQSIVRMCVLVLQTLSVEPTFGARLNKAFQGQESLPPAVRIPGFRGTYADFLIISIYTIITTSKGKLETIYPALLAIINNIAPYIHNLSAVASSRLIQLFATMSSPTFLLANETNHDLLNSLLEAINAMLEHQYEKNAILVHVILRAQKRFLSLRDFAIDGASEELERHAQLRKELADDPNKFSSLPGHGSTENLRSPIIRHSNLTNVPEEGGAFTIGDDEESDEESNDKATPSLSEIRSAQVSQAPSIADSTEDAVPMQMRGMSEKARGKLPINQQTFSRHSSAASLNTLAYSTVSHSGNFEPTMAWIETWLPELPLHTVLAIIEQLTPQLPPQTSSSTSGPTLQIIGQVKIQGISQSPIRVHLFEWSPLSLGWYESVLWGFIFLREMTLARGSMAVWKATHIKLFRIQEASTLGPSLMQPQGAIDAVGSNLIQRIGSLGLGGRPTPTNRHSSSGRIIRDI